MQINYIICAWELQKTEIMYLGHIGIYYVIIFLVAFCNFQTACNMRIQQSAASAGILCYCFWHMCISQKSNKYSVYLPFFWYLYRYANYSRVVIQQCMIKSPGRGWKGLFGLLWLARWHLSSVWNVSIAHNLSPFDVPGRSSWHLFMLGLLKLPPFSLHTLQKKLSFSSPTLK